ncbi:hypothetical protein [Caballeronia grimmiae]|uniref:hypothetical protein n=1 Tax=Caballeronia grimmiae TaxID=1071679 RepID=UPI0038B9A9D8
MLKDVKKNVLLYVVAVVGLAGCHLHHEPTNAQITNAIVESLASFDRGSTLAMAPGLASPQGNSLEKALWKVKLLECKRRTDLLYTCTTDIWMKLDISMSVVESSLPTMSEKVTLDYVYRDGAWRASDAEYGWAGRLIVDKLMHGEVYAD